MDHNLPTDEAVEPPRGRLLFGDDNEMDFYDEIQEHEALALLRADRGPRRVRREDWLEA